LIDGHTGHIKLCDFGLSKILFDRKDEESYQHFVTQSITMEGPRAYSVVGTPPYMAPELVAKLDNGYTLQVDWFSLGVLLYEMVCGDFPRLNGRVIPSSSSSSDRPWPDDDAVQSARSAVGAATVSARRESTSTAVNSATDSAHDSIRSSESSTTAHSTGHSRAQPWVLIDGERHSLLPSPCRDLIAALLSPSPLTRMGPWTESALLNDPFFAPIDWPTVQAGTAPAYPHFDRTLGFIDVFDATGTGTPGAGNEDDLFNNF
jgi:serine/threonine protein kinase